MVNSSSRPSSMIATRLSSSSATLMSIFFFIPQTFVGAISYPSVRAGYAWGTGVGGHAGCGRCFPVWYPLRKPMPESVALYHACANIRFTSAGIFARLWLHVFDQNTTACLRVQKTDHPGQSLPRIWVDNGDATRLGSLEFAVHIIRLKT